MSLNVCFFMETADRYQNLVFGTLSEKHRQRNLKCISETRLRSNNIKNMILNLELYKRLLISFKNKKVWEDKK